MKKNINYLIGFLSIIFMLITSCEEAPLDRDTTPKEQISSIVVKLVDEQKGDSQDDSGLAPTFTTLIGNNVELSSTRSEGVVKRLWMLPDAVILNGGVESVNSETEGIILVETLELLSLSFSRQNMPNLNTESRGFLVTLTETLADGSVEISSTSIQVRDSVKAVINSFSQATVNAPITFRPGTIEELGLSTADLNGENQTVFSWDFGSGRVVDSEGNLTDITTFAITNNPNQTVDVIYSDVTPEGEEGELVTLTVTRNFPLESIAETTKRIVVIAGLVPSRGDGKDPIKLNASGSEIVVGYPDDIANIMDIDASDFELSINTSEIVDDVLRDDIDNITVTSVALNDDNSKEMILSLSSDIPAILMDNVTLSFTSEDLKGESNALLSNFENSVVAQTAENILGNISLVSFEDSARWAASDPAFGFSPPPPTEELMFSSDLSLIGANSFRFNTNSAPRGLGATLLDGEGLMLENSLDYEVSFWVYVVSAEPGSSVDFFLINDFDQSAGLGIGEVERNKWIKVSNTFTIPTDFVRPMVRVVGDGSTPNSGNAEVFVDALDIRLVDDGR
ncbi:hypothetical protein [Aquimarina agarivorans]|uniref:hypothetical protein n=1 Tax=Aquimarina agarivorans TaxID=980584 RepID=UPI000248FB43|nr:hypothetical protein [Aquimarina agarivorans]